MPPLIRGALVEYSSDFLGPLPNIVIFQFNPEILSRTIQMPSRSDHSRQPERNQIGDSPSENISLDIHFHAADQLDVGNPLVETFGIGPQLAALEQMLYPSSTLGGLIGEALDAVGGALGIGGDAGIETQPIPRVALPNILFIWGSDRVYPIRLDAVNIKEQQFNSLLVPIQAEVSIGLSIPTMETFRVNDDPIGRGAFEYSTLGKEAKAVVNLANTVELAIDLVPF